MRWLCDLVGYGPDVVRAADVGRGDGQLHGHGPGPRHPPRAAARGRAGAARGDARGRPGLHLGPDPLLDRPGARPARLPARDAGGHPVGRAVPAARRAGRRGRRPRPRRRPDAVRDRRRRRLDEHGLGRRSSASWPMSPRRRTCGSTSTRRTAAAARLSARDATGCPTSTGPIRSRSIRTSGSSRPTTSAACSSATARTSARSFGGRAPEYYRGGETPADGPPTRRPRRPRRPAQLLQAQLRGHPPLARAQALDVVEAPRHRGLRPARSRPTTTWPRSSPAAAPSPTTSRRSRPSPELSVVCFRHLPGGRDGGAGDARRRARRPPGPTPGGTRGVRRRLADDDPPARRDLAARRHRQLPLDRGRHRPAARDAPRGSAAGGGLSRRRLAAAPRPRSRAGGSRPRPRGPGSSAGSPRLPPGRRRSARRRRCGGRLAVGAG